jgi:hypothetical protein
VIAQIPAVGITGRAAFAGESLGWAHHGQEIYVSKGLNLNHDWGTFVLYPGDGGRALYLKNGAAHNRQLQFSGIFQSNDSPWVQYWVFIEREPISSVDIRHRQWAFQIDHPGLNGFVIYYKDDATDPFIAKGWLIYDFAR